jgi:hypothetical protein
MLIKKGAEIQKSHLMKVIYSTGFLITLEKKKRKKRDSHNKEIFSMRRVPIH